MSCHLQLIGICHWAIELGHIDILPEVSLLLQCQANLREEHLEALCHVFAHLKKHLNVGRITFNLKSPEVDESVFCSDTDWKEFCGDVEEEIDPKVPELRGNLANMSAFVDADHAGDIVTHCLHTGVTLFVCNAPIVWCSEQQNMVESATFGSEFVALQICEELIVALQCELWSFDTPIEGLTNVFCDN
jgi:hypothetical protein